MVLTGEVARVAEASWAAKVTMEEASTEVGGMAVRAKGGGSKGGGKEGGGGNGDGEGEGFMQMNLSSVGAGVVVRGHQRGQGGHGQRQHTVDGTGNESGSRVRARCADGWVKVWAKE